MTNWWLFKRRPPTNKELIELGAQERAAEDRLRDAGQALRKAKRAEREAAEDLSRASDRFFEAVERFKTQHDGKDT